MPLERSQTVFIITPRAAPAPLTFAAAELAKGIGAMVQGAPPAVRPDGDFGGSMLVLGPRPVVSGPAIEAVKPAAGYVISRVGEYLSVAASDAGSLVNAAYRLLRELGARFPIAAEPEFPPADPSAWEELGEIRMEPAFTRRALTSDIMTWHYREPERFNLHLDFDRQFIPWMAARGLNSFFYVRHAEDARYRIDELEPLLAQRAIGREYGGHILPQLLPRELFDINPEFFPLSKNGKRNSRGNLCVASEAALSLIGAGAAAYLHQDPGGGLLHVWGADVFDGAWCACERCNALAPQLQYLAAVNAIARAVAPAAVAYLGYHDTLSPAPGMKPEANVWLEWAPRERCYSHAIDDPGCETNRSCFAALKSYLEIFEGRCHVFEYYGDSVLWAAMSFALPSVIARDLRAYRGLGIRSISCHMFGATSVFAYPQNLIAFAELSQDTNAPFTLAPAEEASRERHPGCHSQLAPAYRAIGEASRLVLTYGDVMRPFLTPEAARRKRVELAAAARLMREAVSIADQAPGEPLVRAERALWNYGQITLSALSQYVAAREDRSAAEGKDAIKRMESALGEMRAIRAELKGTWIAFDLERFHQKWITRMTTALDERLVGG